LLQHYIVNKVKKPGAEPGRSATVRRTPADYSIFWHQADPLGGKADIDQRPTNSVPDPKRISGCRSPRNHHARADADAAVQLDADHQFERIALLCRILKDEPALRPSSPNPLKILPVAEAVSKQPRFQTRRAKQKRHRTGRNRRHRCSCQP